METSSSLENIKTTINIRALISVYENKAASAEPTYSRSRSGSLGNVLSKNVVVRENQIKTLGDVQNILESLEQRLNQYEIYNKEKHVLFQEELFNILTSIINIDNDDPEEAKSLITKTKNYVSYLNTKLPSNGLTSRYSNQVSVFSEPEIIVKEKPTFMSKYKTFKSVEEVNLGNNDEIDSMKPTISVKVLKEIFQVPEVQRTDKIESKVLKSKQTTYKTHSAVSLNNKNVKNITSNQQRVVSNGENTTHLKIEETIEKSNEITSYSSVPVSVLQLRNMFETKSKENATGLSLILKEEKPPITRFNYKTNIAETTKPEDLERIQVSSYLKSIEDDSNGLLEILKRERQPREFNFVLNINNGEEDANHIETHSYLENNDLDQMAGLEYTESSGGNDDDDNDYDGEGGSLTSSEESVKSVDSVKRAVIRVENLNSEAINDSGMIVAPTEDNNAVISVGNVNSEAINDSGMIVAPTEDNNAVISVENVNSEAINDSGMIVAPTEDSNAVISVENVNSEAINDSGMIVAPTEDSNAVKSVENVNSEAFNDSGMIVAPTEDSYAVITVEKVNWESTSDFNS